MQKRRFGVIGAGYGQAVLVPAIRCDPRAEVAAIAATSLEKATRVSRMRTEPGRNSWISVGVISLSSRAVTVKLCDVIPSR